MRSDARNPFEGESVACRLEARLDEVDRLRGRGPPAAGSPAAAPAVSPTTAARAAARARAARGDARARAAARMRRRTGASVASSHSNSRNIKIEFLLFSNAL